MSPLSENIVGVSFGKLILGKPIDGAEGRPPEDTASLASLAACLTLSAAPWKTWKLLHKGVRVQGVTGVDWPNLRYATLKVFKLASQSAFLEDRLVPSSFGRAQK